MAAMIGYNEAKRWSKNPDAFGKGTIEGVAGPEAANNAATGGAMVPTLALGIPGSATAAVILGGLQVQGLRPVPIYLKNSQDFCMAFSSLCYWLTFSFSSLAFLAQKFFLVSASFPGRSSGQRFLHFVL